MPHISLPAQPGILALFSYKPSTATPLKMLAESLLRGHSSLSPGERELIAAFVSRKNNCVFCYMSHAHVAAVLLDTSFDNITGIIANYEDSKLSNKMIVLLKIAYEVTHKSVNPDRVEEAKQFATEEEIHDTVLIASAFCMYNRYVDGLKTELPKDQREFLEMGRHLAKNGYL